MKLVNALLNEQQMDNFIRLFDIALENALAQDVLDNELLPEEINALKEIFIRQMAQGRFDSATSNCPRNERGFTDKWLTYLQMLLGTSI